MTTALRAMLIALIASFLVRCGKAPTEPTSTLATPTVAVPAVRVPTPYPGQLKGTWTGKFTLESCSEDVQVSIDDQDTVLRGEFSSRSRCAVPGALRYVDFNGTIQGAAVRIWLSSNDSEFELLRGYASPNSIDLTSFASNLPAARLTLSR